MLLFIFAAALSFLFCYYYVNHSKIAINDIPNQRSMHSIPVKKAAGLFIISAFLLFSGLYSYMNPVNGLPMIPLFAGSIFFLLLGFLDDLYDLRPITKLIAEVLFLLPFSYFLAVEKIVIFNFTIQNSILITILIAFYFFYAVNLSNFMDGLDLYLSLTIFFAILNFFLVSTITIHTAILIILFLSSVSGFIPFNRHPAKLFLGDTGSLPLGFILAFLPFLANGEFSPITSFLIIPVFWIDGTLTLFYRTFKKEKILLAHKEHLYQRIAVSTGLKHNTSYVFASLNILSGISVYLLSGHVELVFILIALLLVYALLYFAGFKYLELKER